MLAGAAALLAAAPALARKRASGPSWYDKAIVIDGSGGVGDPWGDEDVTRLTDRGWAEFQTSGLAALHYTVMPVGNVGDPWADYSEAIRQYQELFSANPDRLLLTRSAADIERARSEDKVAVVIGTQDSSMVGGDLDRLTTMKKAGVMSVQLTYNLANLSGDGALEPRNGGLTNLGRATIERIEAEKLLLDLAHGGARTMFEAAGHAKRPLVISHTGARALLDHPRNTEDATIRAVAEKGGVVGVYFMPFLATGRSATLDDVIAHVEHVARVSGEDHVGIGSDNGPMPHGLDPADVKRQDDYTRERIKLGIAAPGEAPGVYPWVTELNDGARYRRLARALAKRGWSEGRLEKLMGANLLRVYKEAWGG